MRNLFPFLERLSNLTQASLRAAGQEHGLQPVPLTVLSYLSRANRYSDTTSAIADYLGLTKGAASQVLALLEGRGFIESRRDPGDGRVWRLSLTSEGKRILAKAFPPDGWQQALDAMPAESRAALAAGFEELLRSLQRTGTLRSFGVCKTCSHFLKEGDGFRCGLTQEPLPAPQTEKICREHAPSAPAIRSPRASQSSSKGAGKARARGA